MAYRNRYQYETSPRKVAPEYDRKPKKYPKKSTAKRKPTSKKQAPKQAKKLQAAKQQKVRTVLYVLAIFAIFFLISYRNSTIAEDFSKIKSLKNNLAVIEKENEQLKVNIESNLNLKKVEEAAQRDLGMQKLNNDQTVYISLPIEDYVESASEEVVKTETGNWFTNLVDELLAKIK